MNKPFYGWVITICAFIVLFLTYGAQYSFGVFIPAMLDDLGWTRASLGGVFSFYTVVYTSLSIVSGRLTDSLGPRRVIGIGAILLGTGMLMTSQVSAQWQMFFCYSVIAALGMSTAYIPCNMTVVRWFVRRRGLALGLASSGASCGFLVTPLIAGYLITETDWRTAMLMMGAVLLVVISIAARFMVTSPEMIGQLTDGDDRPTDDSEIVGATAAQPTGITLRDSLTTTSFWVLLVSFIIMMLSLTVPFVHIVSHAQDIGITGMKSAMAVSVIGLFSLVGSITLGTVSDRIGRKPAMVIALISQLVAFGLFIKADTAFVLYCGSAAFGLFYGGFATLFPALVGDLFGRAHAGAIGGAIFGVGGFLGGWGPAIAGYLRDADGDYQLAFLCCLITAAMSVFLFALLPKPKISSQRTV